jgi:hypothetical protein
MALCDELESALKQAQAVSENLTAATIHHLLASTDNACALVEGKDWKVSRTGET